MQQLIQNLPRLVVLAAVADRYNTDPATTPVNMEKLGYANFFVDEFAGGTGTVKITAEACANAAGDSPTEINFCYAVAVNAGTLTDVFGALTFTTVPATGYTTAAGAQKTVYVGVDARDMPEGKPFLRLQLTEVVDSACLASVSFVGTEPEIVKFPMPTVLA